MPFKIVVTSTAQKDIKKLDRVTKKKIYKKIQTYAKTPLFYGEKLVEKRLGDYRWRTGNYKIIFNIRGKTIEILRIRHRKDIYKR